MRIAVFLFALVTSASLLPAVAHAEPPAQLSPPSQLSPPAEPPPAGTGSISGRIVLVGEQPACVVGNDNFVCVLFLLPANLNQPIDLRANNDFILDHITPLGGDVDFSFTGLADGEYFILSLDRAMEDSTPSSEHVSIILDGVQFIQHAVRVTVANGQAVTGIEIVIRAPDPASPGPVGRPSSDGGATGGDCPQQLSPPAQLSPPGGLSLPNDLRFICLPSTGTGTGPGVADGATCRSCRSSATRTRARARCCVP